MAVPSQPASASPRKRRDRRTRWSVRAAERVSRALITVGGVGTIAAVTLIFVFLISVVVPLFFGAEVREGARLETQALGAAPVLHAQTDEYGILGLVLEEPATLVVLDLETGERIARRELFEGRTPTCASVDPGGAALGFGFASGEAAVGKLGFATRFVPREELPPDIAALPVGGRARFEGGVVERVTEDQWRLIEPELELGQPLELTAGDPLLLMDQVQSEQLTTVASLSSSGELALREVRARKNLLTGETSYRSTVHPIPYHPVETRGDPRWLKLTDNRASLFLVWEDGFLQRYDLRDRSAPELAESLDLVEDPDARVTALEFLLGRTTLLVGDSAGHTTAWFEVHQESGEDEGTELRLVRAHAFPGTGAPVRWIDSSSRSRTIAIAYTDGGLRVYQVTAQNLLIELEADAGRELAAAAILPREDGLVAFGAGSIGRWDFELRYPEASLGALFLPVWYEGYAEPSLVWQSSSGTDDAEAKMSLTPLVFGTLKATFYSMIFGAPVALLAAIFCAEFLHARVRSGVKSVIEMMASLPSVVLGFVAALVIAPLVQGALASVLVSFLALPFTLLLGAYLFQLVPARIGLRLLGWPRFALIALTLPLGILLARAAGPALERLAFDGDLEGWLNGSVPGATGGWMMLLIPIAAVVVVFAMARTISPWLRERSFDWDRGRCALADLAKYGLGLVATLALAFAFSKGLDLAGLDPRGGTLGLGRYEQRNALVVGFVMGFAIIPIIFTLAEDALSSVPSHLREASLGAGATHWQTAVRVIIPTASSGLYSAVMIGLGRAVGETMIVLMAVGNTPIMDWNVFNGFRTLSANIATELPEAAVGDAHYRILFLAALLLFSMTFVLNTVAEVVRQRSRRRAKEL